MLGTWERNGYIFCFDGNSGRYIVILQEFFKHVPGMSAMFCHKISLSCMKWAWKTSQQIQLGKALARELNDKTIHHLVYF